MGTYRGCVGRFDYFMVLVFVVTASFLALYFSGYTGDADMALGGMLFSCFGTTAGVSGDDIKELLEKQGRAFEEFKTKNDELVKAKAEGKAVSELQEQVEKINTDLGKISGDMLQLAKRANRIGGGSGEGDTQEQAEHKQAFKEFLRKGRDGDLAGLQQKAYNSQVGSDGAYLVLPEMDAEIARVVGINSAIARISRNVTIGGDTYKRIAKTSGISGRRVGAGATGGETAQAKYAELEFRVYEAEAEPWVHNSTLDDAIVNLEIDLALEAAIAFSELGGMEFVIGSGVDSARGILAYDTVANSSYAWGKLGYVASGGAGAFASTNPGDAIMALQHSLKSNYRPGAVFVMSDDTLSKVRQMKDGSGAYYLWQPDVSAGFAGRILGSPVEIDDNMPSVSANSLSVAYGNFAQGYVVVNRSGTTVIRDQVTQKGKTIFNFRRRFGGGVQNFEAIKLLKMAVS